MTLSEDLVSRACRTAVEDEWESATPEELGDALGIGLSSALRTADTLAERNYAFWTTKGGRKAIAFTLDTTFGFVQLRSPSFRIGLWRNPGGGFHSGAAEDLLALAAKPPDL